MKKFITLAATIFMSAIAFAQPKSDLRPNETVLLYADSFEGNIDPVYGEKLTYADFEMEKANGLEGPENIKPNGNLGNISALARIDLYFPKKPNGQMIIVCPGGGYGIVSSYNEGVYVADWMLSKGITVAVVKYRLPNGNRYIPLTDVQNAFRNAFNLSVNAAIPTEETISTIITLAYTRAINVGVDAAIMTSETSEPIIGLAQAKMLALASEVSGTEGALDDELAEKLSNVAVAAAPVVEETVEEEEEEEEEEDAEEEAAAGLGALFG